MRRPLLTILSTFSGLVLLLSLKSQSPSAARTPSAGGLGTGSSTSTGSTTTGGSSSGSGTTSGTASKPVTGDSVDTRWGPVQVRITVTNGKITSAEAIRYPDGNGRDQEINSQALPVLAEEAVAASSADIDLVSGATYTSEGYRSSLQSALDKI